MRGSRRDRNDSAFELVTALPEIARAEARRVAEAVESELDLLLQDLETWVNIDSPTNEISALDRLAAVIGHRLEEYGLHPELVPAGDRGLYLHAGLEGNGRGRVAFLCHHDTVFPLGTAGNRPFRRDDARCYGPGVADMKGGIAVAAHVARALAKGSRPFEYLEVVSNPDEETRSYEPATIDRLLEFDAVLCMECGRADGSVVSARKGARWFRISANGRASHAGVEPDEGRNAILALCSEAVRLADLHHAVPGLTFQLTGFEGGEGLNTVPSHASLTGDLRGTRRVDLDWAMGEVTRFGDHADIEFSLEDLGGPPALERTAAVGMLAEAAIELGAEVGDSFGETLTGGVSDGSWTAAKGVATLDGLGPVGGLDHTPHEYVETASVARRSGVSAGLVAAIGAGLLNAE